VTSEEPDVKGGLEQLGAEHRVVFAAACCERLLPAYEAFSEADDWGDPRALRDALEAVWETFPASLLPDGEARRLLALTEEQVPHLDDPFESIFTASAQNAAIAVMRCLECAASGSVEHAQQVSELAIDAFETYVDQAEGEGSVYDAERVTSSPVYRRELADQREDLETLGRHPVLDDGTVDAVRSRARVGGFAKVVPSRR
jgi:uncharacterized protein